MTATTQRRRIIPMLLGVAMLAVVVAAALTPNVGVVQAQSNSQYGQPTTSSTPAWEYAAVGGLAIVVIAAIAAALILRRRRPPAASSAPVKSWEDDSGSGGAAAMEAPVAPSPPAPPAAAPAYLETPEDVGHAPPSVPVSAGATAGAAAAGSEAEPDIDSLMAELDKISGEILKRAPKKGGSTPSPSDEDEPPAS